MFQRNYGVGRQGSLPRGTRDTYDETRVLEEQRVNDKDHDGDYENTNDDIERNLLPPPENYPISKYDNDNRSNQDDAAVLLHNSDDEERKGGDAKKFDTKKQPRRRKKRGRKSDIRAIWMRRRTWCNVSSNTARNCMIIVGIIVGILFLFHVAIILVNTNRNGRAVRSNEQRSNNSSVTNTSSWTWYIVLLIISLPLLTAARVTVVARQQNERVISAVFVLAVLCNQLPTWVAAAVGALAVLIFGLMTRPMVVVSSPASCSRVTVGGFEGNDDNEQNNHHHLYREGAIEDGQVKNFRRRRNRRHQHSHIVDGNSDGEIGDLNSDDENPVDEGETHSNDNKRNQHRQRQTRLGGKTKAALAALATIISLLTENFFIWVVSATYYPSHNASPTPLQDNGRSVQQYFFESILHVTHTELQRLRDVLNVPWALVTALGAALACCELHIGGAKRRTLEGVCLRALTTLAAARAIRTVSFVITVLPSQVPGCYRKHFPYPPPTTWMEWLKVGLIPNARGGCNDLIVSGHATVTSTMACLCTSVADNMQFTVAVWFLLAFDYCIEVYQGLHYSVDMWMGAVLTSMIWRIAQPLEDSVSGESTAQTGAGSEGERDEALPKFRPITDASIKDVALYALPPFWGYVVLMVMPMSIANYWILLYFVWTAGMIKAWGFTHYSQHVLICVLYIALGVYL